jgi:hypothetical protein
MSIESGWEHDTQETDQGAEEWFPRAIPVEIKHSETENIAPGSASWMSYPIVSAAQITGGGGLRPTQVCTHKYHRYKAKFTVTIPAATLVYVSNNENSLMSNALGVTAVYGPGQSIPDYDAQQPVYMVFTGTGPVSITVLDESYKNVQ